MSDERPLRGGPIDDTLAHIERLLRDRSLSTDIPDRGRIDKEEELRSLRRLADFSLLYFGAQLFIVQDATPPEGAAR